VTTSIKKSIQVAAQHCSPVAGGASTGECTAEQFLDVDCQWVLIGHSDRRLHQPESEELIAQRLQYVLKAGLKVLYCVSETAEERHAQKTLEVMPPPSMPFAPRLATRTLDALPLPSMPFAPVSISTTPPDSCPSSPHSTHAQVITSQLKPVEAVLTAFAPNIVLVYEPKWETVSGMTVDGDRVQHTHKKVHTASTHRLMPCGSLK
jgi:triosephosphate isomerase